MEEVVERKAPTSAGEVEVYADVFNELNIRFKGRFTLSACRQ